MMLLLKSTLLFSSVIFFVFAIGNGAAVFLDRSGMHARFAAATICGMAAFATMICYFTVPA